jgi:hypothetical protein
MTAIHSTSKYIQPLDNPTAYAHADYMSFAPAPCVCCGCFASEAEQKRTFAVMYDSKLVINVPCAPCCCCSNEQCSSDHIYTYFVDKPPFRSGMCCVCIPCTCCGPPVIFSKTPKCLCVDLTDCYGQVVMAAPSNFYGLKFCICCCAPCYQCIATPLISGLSDADTFMKNMKAAADAYYLKHPEIEINQRALFESVVDNVLTTGGAKAVENEDMNRHM